MRTVFCWPTIVFLSCTCQAFAVPPEPKYKLVPQTPPPTPVNSATVSPDGTLVATASGEGGVRLYEAQTGKLFRVLGDVSDRCVVFAPDGRSLTAAGFHMDKLVSLWDVGTGKRLRTFAGQTEWEADATAISPDGKLLASVATDKQILVWEIATGKLKLQLKDQPARIAALAFSADSSVLASGGGDKIVRLWDCKTGQLRKSLSGSSDWICTLAFSPDGKNLASGSCDWGFHRGHDWPRSPLRGVEQCEWILWDLSSAKPRQTVHDRGRLLSLAISPDSQSLACGIGRDVRLYNLASDGAPRVIAQHDADVTSVAFTPDGSALVSGSHDQCVKNTTIATGALRWRAPGSFETVNSVALSPDRSLLVTGSGDWRFARALLAAGAADIGPGAVRLWDARTGRMLRRLGDPAEQVMALAVSPDGRRVAAGCGTSGGKGVMHVWEAANGQALWSTSDDARELLSIAFAPDGNSLATGAADGQVKIRDAQSGIVRQTLPGHAGGTTAIRFSPDGNLLFCAQAIGGARIWNARSGQLLNTCDAPSHPASFTVDRQVNALGLTQDGTTLAMCASSVNDEFVGSLKLWNVRTASFTREFPDIHGQPMALSPDGSIVATGGKSVKLWDTRTGTLLRELYGYLKRTQSITFSADGKLIVAGGSYGTTNLWEVATGRHLATLFTFNDPQSGAIADNWLAYTPEGYYDGSANVAPFLAWRVGDDLETPQALGPTLHRPDKVAATLNIDPAQPAAR